MENSGGSVPDVKAGIVVGRERLLRDPGGETSAVRDLPLQAARASVTRRGVNGVTVSGANSVVSTLIPRILGSASDGAGEWVGRFRIDLVNGRGWPAPPAEVEVRRESVHVRHELVEVAVMPRRIFADWLSNAAAGPMKVGNVVWATRLEALVLTVGSACYRLTDDSRRQVVLLV